MVLINSQLLVQLVNHVQKAPTQIQVHVNVQLVHQASNLMEPVTAMLVRLVNILQMVFDASLVLQEPFHHQEPQNARVVHAVMHQQLERVVLHAHQALTPLMVLSVLSVLLEQFRQVRVHARALIAVLELSLLQLDWLVFTVLMVHIQQIQVCVNHVLMVILLPIPVQLSVFHVHAVRHHKMV